MEDLDAAAGPLLDINIPSWRLGTPRFSVRGTPAIRASSYAPTEDFRSSAALNRASYDPSTVPPVPWRGSRATSGYLNGKDAAYRPISERLLRDAKLQKFMEPASFTDLTFKPTCDDKAIVRYAPNTLTVTAATPPRLVAEITSPTFLDYELISDFFLTYRSFLSSHFLLGMLFARMRWALARRDENGMIVRVRTFVAMRHWILNYFMDDFVLDYDLRVLFCAMLNGIVEDLSDNAKVRKVQLSVIGELKKCWRRICAQYWNMPDYGEVVSPEVTITPGGIIGNRDPGLDPSYWEREGVEPPQLSPSLLNMSFDSGSGAATPRPGPVGDFVVFGKSPLTPERRFSDEVAVLSPGSPRSIGTNELPGLLPGCFNTPGRPPQSAAGRVMARHTHRRSNSMSDSLREHLPMKRPSHENDMLMSMPSIGSLVRGTAMPPGHSYVDDPNQHRDASSARRNVRQTTMIHPQNRATAAKDRGVAGAMSGSGMKRLLNSVRRALSSRSPVTSPTQASFMRISPVDHKAMISHALPSSAYVPQDVRQQNAGRPGVRIDLLGAEVAEDFKAAIREEQAAMGADRPEYGVNQSSGRLVAEDVADGRPTAAQTGRGLTPSMETYTETYRLAGGDPTPPNTPPGVYSRDTPRRSSYLLHQSMLPSPDPDFPVPPLLHDLDTKLHTSNSDVSVLFGYPVSMVSTNRANHAHQRFDSRATRSTRHPLHRRHSSEAVSSSMRSYDAATESGISTADDEPDDEIEPLRVLRRRPGGDLKAANNIGDLQPAMLRKTQSVGSFVTYADSMRSSVVGYGKEVEKTPNQEEVTTPKATQNVFSLGQLTNKQPLAEAEVDNSQSRGPVRKSFEADAERLAQISDDEDDGGIESALQKLEGRYQGRHQKAGSDVEEIDIEKLGLALQDLAGGSAEPSEAGLDDNAHQQAETPAVDMPMLTVATQALPTQEGEHSSGNKSFLYDASIASSANIVPDGAPAKEDTSKGWRGRSVLAGFDGDDSSIISRPEEYADDYILSPTVYNPRAPSQIGQAQNAVDKNSSSDRVSDAQTFLDDESVDGSDLSSEISEREDLAEPRQFNAEDYCSSPELGTMRAGNAPGSHAALNPLSPQTTNDTIVPKAPTSAPVEHGATELPTPDTTPTAPPTHKVPALTLYPSSRTMEQPRAAPVPPTNGHLRKYSVHLPFILAFDSDILAQQFTLIEKDALNEIDWRDLIDMKWKNAASGGSRSWVDFLRHTNAHGVEVVIARFNIMVKWAISEIVLTQHVEERARCIVKMIHVASHCRRYRNFATLAQLTIALTSNEVSRLAKTWNLVSAQDMATLESLEALITPTRNFYNLRAEMETGTDVSCIPFVGIYTHDLLYNAQKPAEVAGSSPTEPLVNFERCRVAASVVKILLRLLEASTRYTFQPLEGITERCLWVGALSDDDIRRRSEMLE